MNTMFCHKIFKVVLVVLVKVPSQKNSVAFISEQI